MVPTANQTNYDTSPADYGAQIPAENSWASQYDDLDQRALIAQRDAEAKRKSIPPFVQKLSRLGALSHFANSEANARSFLDESRNTELIRWSDSGDSFIVLDEDEFARTLIPELFKHNNYASFVRQLNMYGFHKKVGLSDNSMRASERKNKHPSEYSHPYFKRGRPNLLWLIQKPKNPQGRGGRGGSRNKQEDAEEEVDETFGRDNSPIPPSYEPIQDGTNLRGGRQGLLTMGNMANRLPQEDLAIVQQELQAIRINQIAIAKLLDQTRKEHQQLYGQAKAFHELHEKHDNAINSILTFLATIYHKNIDDGKPPGGGLFPPGGQDGHGNIVDMGDYKEPVLVDQPQQPPYRKRPLLLKDRELSPASTRNGKKSKRFPPRGKDYGYPTQRQTYNSPKIQELSDRTYSNRSSQSPQMGPDNTRDNGQIPEEDIMTMIRNANAQNNSNFPNARMEFPEALSHLQNADGRSPLSPNQRTEVLRLLASENSPGSNNSHAYSNPSDDNTLANKADFDMRDEQIEQLGQAFREQEARMNNLSKLVAPLSPSGSIPGVDLGGEQYNPQNGQYAPQNGQYNPLNGQDFLNMEDIFNSGDYFNDALNNNYGGENNLGGAGAEIPDFDFGTDCESGDQASGRFERPRHTEQGSGAVESLGSSEVTSPANTVNTVDDGTGPTQDDAMPQDGYTPGKRRRKGYSKV